MRTTQDFKALKINEVAECNARARLVYAVDEYANRAFKAGIVARRADAANFDRGTLCFSLRRLDVEAGGNRRQILNVVDALTLQSLWRDGGHGQRNVLHIHRAQCCCHDNGFLTIIIFGLSCLGISCGHQHGAADSAAQSSGHNTIKTTHFSLLHVTDTPLAFIAHIMFAGVLNTSRWEKSEKKL